MADEKLGTLFYEIEARQKQLDDSLSEAERKTKKSGDRMEENLSLGGAASGLIKIFAAVTSIETAFRAAEGVAALFQGNVEGALDAAERIPLGIGSAIAAGRDFVEVISGSREESERIAQAWQEAAENIAAAQSNLQTLTEQNLRAGLSPDQNRLRDVNLQNQETNRQLAEITRIIAQVQRFDVEQRRRPGFGARPGAGVSPLEGFSGAEALEALGISGATTGAALEQLRALQEQLFREGADRTRTAEQRLNDERLRRALGIEDEIFLLRRRDLDQFERERFTTRREIDKRLAAAQTEGERDALRRLEDERLRAIDEREQRQRELDQERLDQEFERRQRELERQQARAEVASPEARGRDIGIQALSVERFLRTAVGGAGGAPEVVEDRKAAGLLGLILDALNRVERRQNGASFG